GPGDGFCADIQKVAPDRIFNLAGRLTWEESVEVLKRSRGVVSGDTGIMHVADLMGRPVLALIGPTAFGYPTQASSEVLEVDLPCRPCTKDGRGRCRNAVYKRCMIDITPESALTRIASWP